MSALRAFLIALKVPQYEECVLGLGFDDVAAYFTFDNADVEAMEEALREKIMRNMRQCQDPKLRHKKVVVDMAPLGGHFLCHQLR